MASEKRTNKHNNINTLLSKKYKTIVKIFDLQTKNEKNILEEFVEIANQ